MIVICINGIARAGKDSFTERVKELLATEGKTALTVSTIDPVKEVYKNFFGWDGIKTPECRKTLNILKLIWIKTSDGPTRYLNNVFKYHPNAAIIFVMVREFDEMEKAKQLAKSMGITAYTLEITRDGLDVPPIEQEFLDSHPSDYKYDFTIHNPTVNTYPELPVLDAAALAFIKVLNIGE
jgi:hypothetical protein